DVLANASGKHHSGDTTNQAKRLGQPQLVELFPTFPREHRHQSVRHPLGDARDLRVTHDVADLPVITGKCGQALPCRIEPREASHTVDHREAAAEMDCRRMKDVALLDECQLRRAAADVDVEEWNAAIV